MRPLSPPRPARERWILASIVLAGSLLACTTAGGESAQTPLDPELCPLGEEQIGELRRRLESEIAELGEPHPWAGAYANYGIDSGNLLWVAPRNGYLMVHHEPMFESTSVTAYGSARFDGDVLHLDATWSDPHIEGRERGPFVVVRNGSLLGLATEPEFLEYVNEVNQGHPYASLSCLFGPVEPPESSNEDDPPITIVGRRGSRIFRSPLNATVLEVLGDPQHVLVDVGRAQGAFPGMRLYPTAPDNNVVLVLETLQATRSEAKCPSGGFGSQPKVGASYSTRSREF